MLSMFGDAARHFFNRVGNELVGYSDTFRDSIIVNLPQSYRGITCTNFPDMSIDWPTYRESFIKIYQSAVLDELKSEYGVNNGEHIYNSFSSPFINNYGSRFALPISDFSSLFARMSSMSRDFFGTCSGDLNGNEHWWFAWQEKTMKVLVGDHMCAAEDTLEYGRDVLAGAIVGAAALYLIYKAACHAIQKTNNSFQEHKNSFEAKNESTSNTFLTQYNNTNNSNSSDNFEDKYQSCYEQAAQGIAEEDVAEQPKRKWFFF